MKNVFFEPWVGENYENGFNGKKILVLGDSHYCDKYNNCGNKCGNLNIDDDKCRNFTTNVVEHFIEYKNGGGHMPWMNTYTNFTNVLLGEKADNKATIEFWNSIVFYNYVQKAQPSREISPSDEDYNNSHPAFIEVLEEYQPDLIFVWGWILWRKIKKIGIEADFPILEKIKDKFYYLEIKGKKIPACGIPHPSTSTFLSEDWISQYLQKAIELA